MRFSRARLVTAGAASAVAACALRYPGDAAEFTYKVSTATANEAPITVRANEAAARLLQESAGRIEFRIFANSSLGNEAQMISQVRLGALEAAVSGDTIAESVVAAVGITSVPFAFATHADVY